MSVKIKISSLLKNFFRGLFFYGMWLAPLCAFYFWTWNELQPYFHPIHDLSLQLAVLALAWWIFSWPVMFALQALWPALLLIFYKSERERSPKRIIPIGERFRTLGLSSPQIFILQENTRLWRNKTWGFFALPSPVGSLLLIDKNISILLRPEQFDVWICWKATEASLARLTSGRFLFFTMVPTFTLLAAFAGSTFASSEPSLVLFSATVGGILSLSLLQFFQAKRKYVLDKKTIANFNLDPAFYFSTLAEVERLNPSLFRKNDFEKRATMLNKSSWFKSWQASVFAPAFLIFAFVGVFFGNKESASLIALFNSPQILLAKIPTPVLAPSAAVVANPSVRTLPVLTNTTGTPSRISQAVLAGDMRAVIQGIGKGQNLRMGDPSLNGATPLLLALKASDLEMVYMLLSMGSNLQTEADKDGKGPLFYALQSPRRQLTLSYILAANVNVEQKANDGQTAYDVALKNGWQDCIDLISKYSSHDERLPATVDRTSNSTSN